MTQKPAIQTLVDLTVGVSYDLPTDAQAKRTVTFRSDFGDRIICSTTEIQHTGKQGLPGYKHPIISDPPPVAPPAERGSTNISQITHGEMGAHADDMFLDLCMRTTEIDYLNGQYHRAGTTLVFLLRIMTTDTVAGPGSTDLTPAETRRRRAKVLLRQLELGLDFYGMPLNYVPLIGFDYFKNTLKNLVEPLKSIESSYFAAVAAGGDLTATRNATTSAVIDIDETIKNLQNEKQDASNQAVIMEHDIASLRSSLDNIWHELLDASEEFKRAVAREAGGCDFFDVILCVGSIAAIAASAGTATMAIVAASNMILSDDLKDDEGNPITGSMETLKYNVEKVSSVADSVESLRNSFVSFRDLLLPQQPELSTLPSDRAKLLMEKEKLDSEIQPYLHLPEAVRYQSLIHSFIDTSIARNNRILEYNAIHNAIQAVSVSIDELDHKKKILISDQARREHLLPHDYVRLLGAGYRATRWAYIRILHQAHRALDYLELNVQPFEVADESSSTLGRATARLISRIDDEMERRGKPLDVMKNIPIELNSYIGAHAGEALLRSGIIAFSIPISESAFQGMSHVKVQGLRLAAPRIPTGPTMTVSLTHHGNSRIVDQRGRVHNFSHIPVSGVSKRFAGKEDFSIMTFGGGDYVGVSPFGAWTLYFYNHTTHRPEFVQDIVLYMTVSYLPARV